MITDSLDKGLRDVICEIANDDNVVLSNKIHDLIFFDISNDQEHGDYATSSN